MHQSIANLCTALDSLSNRILTGFGPNTSLVEHFGYHHPAITRQELSSLSQSISQTLKELKPEQIDDQLKEIVDSIPAKVLTIETHTVPHFYSGNGVYAIPAFLTFVQWLHVVLQPLLGWTVMNDPKSMPLQLSRKLKGVQSQFDELLAGKEEITSKISLINDAHSTAESLPVDMETLKETRKKIDVLHQDSASLFGKIDELFKSTTVHSKTISDKKEEADKLVAQCEEAYRITTSKGLAGAFEQRANKLNQSMWIWVGGLLIALAIGAWIGSFRVDSLTKELQAKDPSMLVVWTNLVLSIFSIGAPVWFAWIATKQIAQRFKLAEDYAFKSSVAKAYEGYRREAARIDVEFEARLFSSALTRLDEPPLRVMEHQNYGSPWQELLHWPEFKEVLNQTPKLKDKLMSKLIGIKETRSEEKIE